MALWEQLLRWCGGNEFDSAAADGTLNVNKADRPSKTLCCCRQSAEVCWSFTGPLLWIWHWGRDKRCVTAGIITREFSVLTTAFSNGELPKQSHALEMSITYTHTQTQHHILNLSWCYFLSFDFQSMWTGWFDLVLKWLSDDWWVMTKSYLYDPVLTKKKKQSKSSENNRVCSARTDTWPMTPVYCMYFGTQQLCYTSHPPHDTVRARESSTSGRVVSGCCCCCC